MKKIIITLLIIINMLPSTLIGAYRIPFQVLSWDCGTVLDTAGNGVTTTPFTDDYYNYIAYDEGLEPGTTSFTIFIYNPVTLWNDDIIERYDFY